MYKRLDLLDHYEVNMGRFYFDTEFTNGNYYLADIIEIALVAEESGNAFHSYVKLHYSIPRRVQQLTNITNKTLKSIGLPFRAMMDALIEFIYYEQAQSETIAVIIAHGGILNDFPILLANCMKHGYTNYSILTECAYVDSMQLFRNAGYTKPGLDALCQEINSIKEARNHHSAIDDAEMLMAFCCKKRIDSLLSLDNLLTFNDTLLHLNEKLPISIWRIFNLSRKCTSYKELECKLYEFSKERTALNHKQVCKIAYWFFKDRYLYYSKQL